MTHMICVPVFMGEMSHLAGSPKKPIDVNFIKKVFWLIKFVADYFFVKGMATSGGLLTISGRALMTSGLGSRLPVDSLKRPNSDCECISKS